jgi:hypothetical protein
MGLKKGVVTEVVTMWHRLVTVTGKVGRIAVEGESRQESRQSDGMFPKSVSGSEGWARRDDVAIPRRDWRDYGVNGAGVNGETAHRRFPVGGLFGWRR